MTKNEFIATLAPTVVLVRCEGSPLFPSVRLAQNLLETGGTIHSWNNLGGIKVGSGKPNEWWTGGVVQKGTWEVYDGSRTDTTAAFRAYESVYHFYKDQDLLFEKARYARIRAAMTPEEQAEALYQCGYATDPNYAGKLISIMNGYGLKKYDREAEQMAEQLQQQIEGLLKRVEALEQYQKQPAPAWFIQEFGSADLGGLINEPSGSPDFWRALAVTLRAAKAGKLDS